MGGNAKDRIALVLALCLGLIILFLGVGGLIAATKGTDFGGAPAALVGTISGGILSAIAAILLGKDDTYVPPPVAPVITDGTEPLPEAPSETAPAGDEAAGVEALVAEPVVAEPVAEQYGVPAERQETYDDDAYDNVTAEFTGGPHA